MIIPVIPYPLLTIKVKMLLLSLNLNEQRPNAQLKEQKSYDQIHILCNKYWEIQKVGIFVMKDMVPGHMFHGTSYYLLLLH